MGILRLLLYFLLQLIIVIIIACIWTFKAVRFLAERDMEKELKPLRSHVHGTSLSPLKVLIVFFDFNWLTYGAAPKWPIFIVRFEGWKYVWTTTT